ncbi:flagellar protein FlaG [Halalkalibacter okhensis]|uniref:Flagellar protein FlaG n=1 Tax=Halalkalibacter okhensis TaxID=333138 RepID=A0A0B0IAI1_9BACI|nr:flagellar protein FlaG [Halalkalibacter okhensis]KHF37832.1 hypothetical protein LQ50_25155 [Halalkalibacter okhensis]
MDIKGTSSQGISELVKLKSNGSIHDQSPRSIIEKGVEELKEHRESISHSKDKLDKKVEGMNDLLESSNTAIKFNIHEDLNRLYVQVVNKETDEVVKEIPPEEFLDMVASMLKHAGLIFDERV